MKQTRKYQTITGFYGYTVGIFDNCDAKLQTNGRRYRLVYDAVVWRNNSGGLRTITRYMSIEEGRKLLRAIRQADVHDLKGNYGAYRRIDLLTDSA